MTRWVSLSFLMKLGGINLSIAGENIYNIYQLMVKI